MMFLLQEVKLHYRVSGPEHGKLMILLHGFPEFWYSWRHQIREFQKKYRYIVCPPTLYISCHKYFIWRI